jgi:hypothetical protein
MFLPSSYFTGKVTQHGDAGSDCQIARTDRRPKIADSILDRLVRNASHAGNVGRVDNLCNVTVLALAKPRMAPYRLY